MATTLTSDKTSRYILYALLVFSWFPIRGIFLPVIHFVPVVFLVLMAAIGKIKVNTHATLIGCLYISMLLLLLIVNQNSGYLIHYLIFLILVFPIFILLFDIPRLTEDDVYCFLKLVAMITIFEFILGCIQIVLFQGLTLQFRDHAWDQVTGTTLGRSSHTFSIKMLFQSIILAFNYRGLVGRSKRFRLLFLTAIFCGFAGALISSFMLGVLLAVFGLIVIYLFQQLKSVFSILVNTKIGLSRLVRGLNIITASAILLFVLGFAFVTTQPGNVDSFVLIFQELMALDFSNAYRFQKVTAFFDTLEYMLVNSWIDLFFGVGPGQFSSRAALILTGEYLYPQPSYLPVSMTSETFQHIYPLWNERTIRQFGGSVLAMPTSSFQAIFTELGLVGIAFFGIVFHQAILYKGRSTLTVLKSQFLNSVAIIAFLTMVQLTVELWLEYASFTVFIFTLFLMSRAITRSRSTA